MLRRGYHAQEETLGETERGQETHETGGECRDPPGGVSGRLKTVMTAKLNPKRIQKSAAREWAESIVIAFVLAMFIRTFFIQAFKIPSGSMIPTLVEGDRLMVNKLRYGPKVPLTKDKRLPGFGRSEEHTSELH